MGFAFNLAPLPFRTQLVDEDRFINQTIWLRALIAMQQSVNQNTAPGTFAKLPAKPVEGMVFGVTDSTVNSWGATVAGGGSYHVLAYFNGSHWKVIGA